MMQARNSSLCYGCSGRIQHFLKDNNLPRISLGQCRSILESCSVSLQMELKMYEDFYFAAEMIKHLPKPEINMGITAQNLIYEPVIELKRFIANDGVKDILKGYNP